jgi:type I restriction enzyme S subunit
MKTFNVASSEDTLASKALDRLSLIPSESVLVVVRSGILSRTLPVALNKVPVTINQDMRAFVPEKGISSTYLAWQLVAREQEILSKCSKDGTTVASIEGPALARFPLATAPTAEQTRIVAKLEELLSDLDAGVAELKAAQKKLGQYRQSLLKAAVEGTLTADWRQHNPPTETGAQLLDHILTERRARWEARQLAKFKEQGKAPPKDWESKYPEPVKPDTSGLPKLPESWVWGTVDQLAEFVTSGSRGWADYYASEGPIFIRSQNINKDWLDLSDTAFVNPPPSNEGARTRVQTNDLLLTITGANVGKAARVNIELKEAYVSQHVALIRPIIPDISHFLHLFLTASAGGRGQLEKAAYGAGKPGLNLQQVAGAQVPIPPREELLALVKTVLSLFGGVVDQELSIDQTLKQSAAQRKNILKAAFSGQLVPQDPADEPASVLLERIRAEREARGLVKKPRGRKTKEPA